MIVRAFGGTLCSRRSERMAPRKSTAPATPHMVPTPPKMETPPNRHGRDDEQLEPDGAVRPRAGEAHRVDDAGEPGHEAGDDEQAGLQPLGRDAGEPGRLDALAHREDPAPGPASRAARCRRPGRAR